MLLEAEGSWPVQESSGPVSTKVVCFSLALGLSCGNFPAVASGLGNSLGDHRQDPLLSLGPKLKQMEPDGQICFKMLCL